MSQAQLLIDPLGTGQFYNVLQPLLKIPQVLGKVELPSISLSGAAVYSWAFTIPSDITNIFLSVVGMPNCDYSFDFKGNGNMVINIVGWSAQDSHGPGVRTGYLNPVTRQGFNAYILYGGIRG